MMRILLADEALLPIVGREYIDDDAEGEFVVAGSGEIVYRHPSVGELFANTSKTTFAECVRAWERYVVDVAPLQDDAAQVRVVEALKRELTAQDALRERSFWQHILEQAEYGHL